MDNDPHGQPGGFANMEINNDDLVKMYHQFKSERLSLEAARQEVDGRLEAVTQVLAGLEEMVPSSMLAPQKVAWSLRSALTAVLDGHAVPVREGSREVKLVWRTPGELVLDLEIGGFSLADSNDPEAAVRAALRRMQKGNEVMRRPRDGRSHEYATFVYGQGEALNNQYGDDEDGPGHHDLLDTDAEVD